jgi:hypothetical protein
MAWADRKRGQGYAKWDGGASAGAGGAQKGDGVRGWATWPGISACVRVCWSTAGAVKAELTGRSHGTARESGRAGVTVRHTDETGPRGRGGEGRVGEGN